VPVQHRAQAGSRAAEPPRVSAGTLSRDFAQGQIHRRFMLKKHLLPRFGEELSEITRQEIQAYVAHLTQAGYAPRAIDHIHDVLSAVLRTAMFGATCTRILRVASTCRR
jgi:hypothetical protein